jgi:general secretion pathway protein J
MPSHIPQTNRQQGFTLLEVLIASIIFAIMAVMAYGGLQNVIDNSQSSKQALNRLQQLQKCISVLNRDMLQIIPRPIRDEYGTTQPALSTSTNLDYIVEFTRSGRPNPTTAALSTLQRVAYQLEEDKLIRLQWPHLDRTQEVEPRKSILIDNVEDVTISFLDENNVPHTQWPPLNTTATNTGATQTSGHKAIEVIIHLKDWGPIRRLFVMQ